MKSISINNGRSATTPEEALKELGLDTIAQYMDDETREKVAYELAPCAEIDFLRRYLEIAPDNLIIG